MAQTPSQQIQIIPQPLSSSQLQQFYMPQQHIFLPGNVTLQQGGSLTSSPGVNFQLHAKPSGDSKTFGVQNIQPYQNALVLQPKPTFSAVQNQVLSSQIKQLSPRTSVPSPASGTLYSHPQLLGSYALSPLPPGYTWAPTPSSFPCSQSPIIISREQPNIYVQSQSQAAIQLPVVSGQFTTPSSLSCSHITQSVQSIATQTSAPSSLNSGIISYPTQEQNVESIANTINSAIPEKLIQSSLTISPLTNDQLLTEDSKTVASMQTENLQAVHEVQSIKEESQFSSLSIVPGAETVPSPALVLNGNCATEMPVDVCPSPTSAVSSTSSTFDLQQPVLNTEKISRDFVSHSSDDNKCHGKLESEIVPEKPKKPVADIKPVPEKTHSSANVPENIDHSKHCVKLTNEQKMARFNPVIKLKRLKPQDAILTPYSRVVKDKQPQKAIVKPQMLSHVIDSYVIQEVTLKSVVDSSSTDISQSSNSEDKNEVSMPGVSSLSMESSTQMEKDTVLENVEILPLNKVVHHAIGRPRRRGRPPKKSKQIIMPIRRSLRQKSAVSVIGKDYLDVAEEEDNCSRFYESSSIYQTVDEHFLPHDTTDSDFSFDISTLAAVSSEIGKAVVDVHKKPPNVWSVQEVFEFVRDFPGCLEFAETFKAQEIDGQALLLMNLDHLMTGMNMKLGPALKMIAHISSMKEQGHQKVFEAVGGRMGHSHVIVRGRGRPRKNGGISRQKFCKSTENIGADRNTSIPKAKEDHSTRDETSDACQAISSSSRSRLCGEQQPRKRRGRPRKDRAQQDDDVMVVEEVRRTNGENSLRSNSFCDVPDSRSTRRRGRAPKRTQVCSEGARLAEGEFDDIAIYGSALSEPTDVVLFCDISNFHARSRSRSRSRCRVENQKTI